MTDEIKLLTDQRSPIKKWADENRRIVAPSGRLVFPDFPVGGEIDLKRHRQPTFDPPEFIVPKDDPRGRMIRHGETTGRWSGRSFVMQVKLTDEVTPGVKKVRDQLRFYQSRAYYGERIATLLHSTDPRQRKRGKRLRDQRFSFGRNLSELEARVLVGQFRDVYPDLKAFYDTQLGEPWDPTRYRKD